MAVPSARRPAGRGLGALAGDYPDPALGLPLSVGPVLWDDFARGTGELAPGLVGDLGWSSVTLGGLPVLSSVAPIDPDEVGILQATTGGTAGGGVVVGWSYAPILVGQLVGLTFGCRLRLTSGLVAYEVWSGFASTRARVRNADTTQFIGIRSVGANLHGVCKTGTGQETEIDLGVSCEGSLWVSAGFEVTAAGVQFFRLDANGGSRSFFDRTDIGAPVATDVPTIPLAPVALGAVQVSATTKIMQLDWWGMGGRTQRG